MRFIKPLSTKGNVLSNEDLVPTKPEERQWTTRNFALMWMGVINNLPTYATVAGLVVLGFSPLQSVGIALIAASILYAALTLIGRAGSEYGIPFPVVIRTSFGIKGSNVPALMRGIVAIFWLAVQTFAGSTAFYLAIAVLWPGFRDLGGGFSFFGLSLPGLIAFLLFWLLHIILLNNGLDALKKIQNWTGPVTYTALILLLIWALKTTGGIGNVLSTPGRYGSWTEAFWPYAGAVIGLIGTWATLILNIPDFTRQACSTRDQVKGQLIGLPLTFSLFTLAAVSVTVATQMAYGTPLNDLIDVFQQFDNKFVVAAGALVFASATITVNCISNIISAAYDFANILPRWINFKRGFYMTMILSLFTFPWKILENPDTIFSFLNTIGGVLGPVAGIMIADYWIIRKQHINVDDLYKFDGEYQYKKGYNYRAFVATAVGFLVPFIGLTTPILEPIHTLAWLVGVLLSFFTYIALMRFHPVEVTTEHKQTDE